MKTLALILFFAVGELLLATPVASAADITAKTCEQPDVQAAIGLSKDLDRVVIPPGSCDWLLPVEIIDKAITLWADGACVNCGSNTPVWTGGTRITCKTHACLVIKNKIGNALIRVTGVNLVFGAGTEFLIYNQAWNFRVDNMKLESQTLCQTYNIGGTQYGYYPSGVYDHNLFVNCRHLLRGDGEGGLRDGWRQPSIVGTGEVAFAYTLEDNSFLFNVFGNATDLEFGATEIFRRNYLRNVYVEVHGLHPEGGASATDYPALNGRSWQIQDNTSECEEAFRGTGQCYAAFRLRGGTGVVFNNRVLGAFDFWAILDNQRSDNNWPGVNGSCSGLGTWDMNLQGQLGHFCLGQIGTGMLSPSGLQPQTIEPAYFWSNLFLGNPAEPAVIGSNNVKPGGSGADIVKGRDWYAQPRPGYTSPPYPHPLVNGGVIPPPPPPPPDPCVSDPLKITGIKWPTKQTGATSVTWNASKPWVEEKVTWNPAILTVTDNRGCVATVKK